MLLHVHVSTLKVVANIPQAVCSAFATFIVSSQDVVQLVTSPTIGLIVLPVHMTQTLPSL